MKISCLFLSLTIGALSGCASTSQEPKRDTVFCYEIDAKSKNIADEKVKVANSLDLKLKKSASEDEKIANYKKIDKFYELMFRAALIGNPEAIKFHCNMATSNAAPSSKRDFGLKTCHAALLVDRHMYELAPMSTFDKLLKAVEYPDFVQDSNEVRSLMCFEKIS